MRNALLVVEGIRIDCEWWTLSTARRNTWNFDDAVVQRTGELYYTEFSHSDAIFSDICVPPDVRSPGLSVGVRRTLPRWRSTDHDMAGHDYR